MSVKVSYCVKQLRIGRKKSCRWIHDWTWTVTPQKVENTMMWNWSSDERILKYPTKLVQNMILMTRNSRSPIHSSSNVYLFSGIRNKTVLEFPSLQSFKKKAKPQTKQLQLPFHWQGTGHVVLDGFLYYHKADTPNQILKFDLLNSTVVDRTFIPGAGKLPTYSLNLNTYMDLAVDELGLWVIYADPDYGGNLVITKLDKGTLAVEYTWDTQCKSRDAEGAFLMCGTLYVVYNTGYGGRSTIQCLYDIHDTIHSNESPVMFFPKRYSSHSSIHYHPGDKQLYAWDDGYQTIYEVETRRSD